MIKDKIIKIVVSVVLIIFSFSAGFMLSNSISNNEINNSINFNLNVGTNNTQMCDNVAKHASSEDVKSMPDANSNIKAEENNTDTDEILETIIRYMPICTMFIIWMIGITVMLWALLHIR